MEHAPYITLGIFAFAFLLLEFISIFKSRKIAKYKKDKNDLVELFAIKQALPLEYLLLATTTSFLGYGHALSLTKFPDHSLASIATLFGGLGVIASLIQIYLYLKREITINEIQNNAKYGQ